MKNARWRESRNRGVVLREEDEKMIRSVKRKRAKEDEKVFERRKMTEQKFPLADFYKMSRKSANSKEEIVEKSSSNSQLDKQVEPCYDEAGILFGKSSEEDSEEDKKHYNRSPFYIKRVSDFINFKLCGIREKEKDPESDEELLLDCDRRNEVDHGYTYVLKKRWRAITNPINHVQTYHKTGSSDRIRSVLHDPKYPLLTLSKLALRTYNEIQGTQYEFVGLVKAYLRLAADRCFTIRFKASVGGQDAINFQASIFEEIPDRKTNVVFVRVEAVYPLPSC
ncbi:uncharacterized protein LOC141684700 [Apium graveolens]|uniref:uncharacterized protein LOC141684700 n=1 Tax=Apium graveolens TaxID=4045 RepID=UPI003D79624D